jgi:hypothetical protein
MFGEVILTLETISPTISLRVLSSLMFSLLNPVDTQEGFKTYSIKNSITMLILKIWQERENDEGQLYSKTR